MSSSVTPQAHNPPARTPHPSAPGESTSPRSVRMGGAERELGVGLQAVATCENSGREANGDSGSS
jgi:hypothetical protein